MRAITIHTDELETATAIAHILVTATEQLCGEQPVAGFVFASTDYEHQDVLDAILGQWPDLPLIGGSTDGEVSDHGFAHDSIVLTLLVGEDLRARVGLGRELSKDLDRAVDDAMRDCGEHTRMCWTLFAPTGNSSAIVCRLQELASDECMVVGGLTGDHREFSRMVEFCGREVLTDSLPVMLLEGDFEIGCGIGSGWFPIGPSRTVTRCDGHWLHEIDGKPALDLYKEICGTVPAPDGLAELPLAVFPAGVDGDYQLRAVLDADLVTGSLRLAGEVFEGEVVRLTEVLVEGLLSGARQSVANAVADYPGNAPVLAFVFSCAARKWVLGTRASQEIEHLTQAFTTAGLQPAIAGGYFFGEIGAPRHGEPSRFHSETCVTVLLGK